MSSLVGDKDGKDLDRYLLEQNDSFVSYTSEKDHIATVLPAGHIKAPSIVAHKHPLGNARSVTFLNEEDHKDPTTNRRADLTKLDFYKKENWYDIDE